MDGPAIPLDDAGPYVAAAYLVFLGLVLLYVAIMARRTQSFERDLKELEELVEQRFGQEAEDRELPASTAAGKHAQGEPKVPS